MKRKILIEKTEGQIRTFFLEDGDIVEIHCADPDQDRAGSHRLGDIYIGKVKNIVPNIGAAFVEIENGISCYYDMKDVSLALFTNKTGKKPLCIGDELVVQISKEAVKTKAPTVTGNISFTGRYAVLTHGNTRIGVSSKLPKSLRDDYKEKLRVRSYCQADPDSPVFVELKKKCKPDVGHAVTDVCNQKRQKRHTTKAAQYDERSDCPVYFPEKRNDLIHFRFPPSGQRFLHSKRNRGLHSQIRQRQCI